MLKAGYHPAARYRRLALLVTADHGQLNIPADQRIEMADHPALSAGVLAVSGEARARYLHVAPGARGDVRAAWQEAFGDFEFAFEWKIPSGGNSGVKYNVSEAMTGRGTGALGFEYQILDDDRHPDAKAGVSGNRTAAGLYGTLVFDMVFVYPATASLR